MAAEAGGMERVVKEAIDIGYRHFDSAWFYKNEKEVGGGIRTKISEGVVKREEVFVTTKLWNTHHRPDMVVDCCKRSVANFGLEYVDLYLIHWPFAFKEGDNGVPKNEKKEVIYSDVDYVDTWKQMEECVRQGLTKSIGLSNFNSHQIKRILEIATIKPVVNQIECHPYLNQTKLIKFCKDNGIVCTGYSPFGGPTSIAPLHKGESPEPLKDPKIKELADKYGKSVAQIILRYLIQHGIVPIPKSSNKKRLAENIDVFNFELKSEDVAVMDSLNRDKRICDFIEVKNHKHYPFNIEF
ncbi:1,5-anhydro-D-fructose reductase [Blattella germanica]|nr:1,5-anhydro-D-fructose reductase [Blattella germanica]